MPVHIQINGENAAHALSELRGLADGLFPMPLSSGTLALSANTGDDGSSNPTTTRTTRGRRGKTESTVTEQPAPQPEPVVQQAIQTGGERVDTAAQDKADEQADTAKQKGDAPKLTVDDLRAAAKAYIDKFGMAAASSDLMACLNAAVPGKDKFSAYGDASQEEIATAKKALEDAGAADKRYGQ